jgi:hypothetical protein
VPNFNLEDYIKSKNALKVKDGFVYNSGTNSEWLSVEDLRRLIKNDIGAIESN